MRLNLVQLGRNKLSKLQLFSIAVAIVSVASSGKDSNSFPYGPMAQVVIRLRALNR